MQPWVIRQGDFVLKLADKFGFDPDAVWQDPKNDDLRAQRSNPNILLPTDVLYIPTPQEAPATALNTGTTNTFTAPDPLHGTVCVKFVGADDQTFASKPFTVQELEELTGLTTDADGVATFEVPVTLETITIVFSDTEESYELAPGGLDPINTLSGVFQRLQNLGFVGGDATCDSSDLETPRAGLAFLRESRGGGGATPDSQPPASASGDQDPSAAAAAPQVDDEGLSDDGTVSHKVQQMLLDAHGS